MADEDRWVSRMNSEFNPGYSPVNMPKDDARAAIAAEYSAFQLYKIRQALENINASLASLAKATQRSTNTQ